MERATPSVFDSAARVLRRFRKAAVLGEHRVDIALQSRFGTPDDVLKSSIPPRLPEFLELAMRIEDERGPGEPPRGARARCMKPNDNNAVPPKLNENSGLPGSPLTVGSRDAAGVILLSWSLLVMGFYDRGPAIHALLIAAVILLIVPFRAKRSRSVEPTSSPNVATSDWESRRVAKPSACVDVAGKRVI
jgi:hypothetical protein